MAAVTSPETSPQPRVYFQTPAGTTEEPETPVRKQGRVTVKYDRKELRKRLNLEEWIIDQLTDLYDCEVKSPNNNRPRCRSNLSIMQLSNRAPLCSPVSERMSSGACLCVQP